MTNRKRDNDTALGCIVHTILGLLFIPIVGLFLICSKKPEKKNLGWILLIVGVLLWIIFAVI